MMVTTLLVFAFYMMASIPVTNSKIQLFDDATLQYLVSKHNEFCKTPDGCSEPESGVHFGENLLTSGRRGLQNVKCCDKCSCDNDCIKTGNCCPEMLNVIPRVSTRTFCSSPQLRPGNDDYPNSGINYLMIKGCSDTSDGSLMDGQVRHLCEKAENYDLMDTKIPVSDHKSSAVYINRYCAYCNGVSDSTLIYWKPNLLCKERSRSSLNMNNIVNSVSNSEGCNLLYNIPEGFQNKVKQCRIYYSSCNVTGLWTHYDQLIEEACNAYTVRYNLYYSNVFCYLCNSNTTGPVDTCKMDEDQEIVTPDEDGVVISFSAILRFKPYEKDTLTEREAPECNVNQIYDYFMDVCRNVSCYHTRTYIEDKCVNLFENVAGVAYRFYIKLVSWARVQPEEMVSMTEDIKRFIFALLFNLSVPLDNQITRVFTKFNGISVSEPYSLVPQCTFNQSQESEKNIIEYYLVLMDFEFGIGASVNSSFIDNILALEDTNVTVKRHSGIDVSFRASFLVANLSTIDGSVDGLYDSVSGEIVCDERQYGESEHEPDGGEPSGAIKEPPAGTQRRLLVDGIFLQFDATHAPNDIVSGQTVENARHSASMGSETSSNHGNVTKMGFLSNENVEILTPTHVCPLVSFSDNEFKIRRYNWGIRVEQLHVNISIGHYIEAKVANNYSSFYVCKVFYVDVTNKLSHARRTSTHTKPQGVLSLVCTCLSIACSILALVTYALFKELRTQPGINNIMLISSLICAQVVFQFGIGQTNHVPDWLCKGIGVIVHFSWLVTLMWMNVCSLHMFRVFRNLKQKSGESMLKTTLAYTTYSFSIAIVPVLINVIYSNLTSESGDNIGYGGNQCYISELPMVGFLFLLPVCFIVLINISLFIAVIVTISKLPKLDGNASKNRNYAKIYIKISSLTGLTWIFGFIFAFTEFEVLEYVFIVLNCGLGVFIFLSFVCNKRVFKLYTQMLMRQQNKTKYSESTRTSSVSETHDRYMRSADSTK